MKITKYVTPASPIDAVFDRLGLGLSRSFGELETNGSTGWTAVRLPRTQVAETNDAYLFTLEMPGLSRETRILEKHAGEWKIVYVCWLLEGQPASSAEQS